MFGEPRGRVASLPCGSRTVSSCVTVRTCGVVQLGAGWYRHSFEVCSQLQARNLMGIYFFLFLLFTGFGSKQHL